MSQKSVGITRANCHRSKKRRAAVTNVKDPILYWED